MEFGLTENVIEKIRDVFRLYPEIDEAIIYGSRAMDKYKTASDIDLTFKGNDLSLNVLSKIEWALDDLLLPYTFDLSIFNKITNPDLVDHIKRVGRTFYLKSE